MPEVSREEPAIFDTAFDRVAPTNGTAPTLPECIGALARGHPLGRRVDLYEQLYRKEMLLSQRS